MEGEINKREMHLWFLVFVKFMLVIDIESERIENCRKNGEELGSVPSPNMCISVYVYYICCSCCCLYFVLCCAEKEEGETRVVID